MPRRVVRSRTKTVTRTKTRTKTRGKRRINGKGISQWLGKAGAWARKLFKNPKFRSTMKQIGKAGIKLFEHPEIRKALNDNSGKRGKAIMSKADSGLRYGRIAQGVLGNGKHCKCKAGCQKCHYMKKKVRRGRGLGYGLGMYGYR